MPRKRDVLALRITRTYEVLSDGLTVIGGRGFTRLQEARKLAERVGKLFPDQDVEVHTLNNGLCIYRRLISSPRFPRKSWDPSMIFSVDIRQHSCEHRQRDTTAAIGDPGDGAMA